MAAQHGDQFESLHQTYLQDKNNTDKEKDLVNYIKNNKQGQHPEVILQVGINIA